MPQSELAQALEDAASKDDFEIKPALRRLMNATAQLLRATDNNKSTQTATQAELEALRKEFDSYKNRAIGFSAAVSLLMGGVGALLSKLLVP